MEIDLATLARGFDDIGNSLSEESLSHRMSRDLDRIADDLKPSPQKCAEGNQHLSVVDLADRDMLWDYKLDSHRVLEVTMKFGLRQANEKKHEHIRAIENARRLGAVLTRLKNAAKGAGSAIEYIDYAVGQLHRDLNILISLLDQLADRLRHDQPSEESITAQHTQAIQIWNKIIFLAKEFRKDGILVDVEVGSEGLASSGAPADTRQQLQILAAHYGGINITEIASILFINGDKLEITKERMGPIGDPWRDAAKIISVVYKLGGEILYITSGELHGSSSIKVGPRVPGGMVEAVTDFVPAPPPGCRIRIVAAIWGPELSSNQRVYDKLYKALKLGREVRFDNATMGAGVDPWKGNLKSGVVVCTFGDTAFSLHQIEGKVLYFPGELRPLLRARD
ncbi:hypothetical protein TWF481_003182 [Arthrobotrys musiformis]|uniref:Uncharacterized protein n=1 Tax=Arthrobotrys musiformis TaxID=47236 RepID=A0AAV9VRM0_9PEZI